MLIYSQVRLDFWTKINIGNGHNCAGFKIPICTGFRRLKLDFFQLCINSIFFFRVREGTWEGLDDAVYYVKAVGNTVEFCFAVFLFFNGGKI